MNETKSVEGIKSNLQRHRAELEDQLDELSSRRRVSEPKGNVLRGLGDVPLWALAAGGLTGYLFMRQPLWPLRVAGKLAGIAAPVALPLLVKRLRRSD